MTVQTPVKARAQYEADGFYIHSQPIVPAECVHRAIAGMDAVRAGEYDTGVPPQPSPWNPGDDPRKLCKIEMPQVASRAIMELIRHPALGELAAAITGASWVQVWWVQLLYKPPATEAAPTNVGWHQDRHYWQVWEGAEGTPPRALTGEGFTPSARGPDGSGLFTAWVALSDVTRASGPMRFVRGSHRWGYLGGSDFYGQDHASQQAAFPLPEGALWEEVEAVLPPGGVSFHHNLTLHASGPNRSDVPRRSFALHMRTERSRPVEDRRHGLTAFIDDPSYCPVIYER
jgi:hypothetical protein